MRRITSRAAVIAVAAITAVGAGAGVAVATGGDDRDVPINGTDLERATKAALAHTGGGTVSGTEVGDEESYYEVEITLKEGSKVDVQLDRSFRVVGSESDRSDNESGAD
jgi:hypothetical protein